MDNVKDLIAKIESGEMSYEDKLASLAKVEDSLLQMRQKAKEQAIGSSVEYILESFNIIKAKMEKRLAEMVPEKGDKGDRGQDGKNGRDGKDGKDGKDGRDGAPGLKGADGEPGADGQDGVSVTDAHIDFDGSLVISLSSGRVINVGEVVAPDLAEKIKVITNGGGTSQSVLDTLTSLQNQINTLIPSQTGNAGKFLTTNGTSTSWAVVSGSGAVDSVNGQTGVVVLDAADVGAEPADATILKDADIGVTVQGYSAVLAGTTASFTTADETKLDGIEAGAEVNVNADWNAVSGDAQILNKPTLGTAAAAATTDFATAAQGTKADSALQAADIGVTVQGYSAVLAGTTASFTTADETKLDGIAAGAEVNVNADWNATSGDAEILNKPTLGTAAATDSTDYATAAQGALADSALQAADIGVTVQGYSAVLAGTTASFTTADETKLDGIEAGAEVNVNADWNAVSGDAQILNKPAILAFSGGITTVSIVSSLPGSPDANTLYVVV